MTRVLVLILAAMALSGQALANGEEAPPPPPPEIIPPPPPPPGLIYSTTLELGAGVGGEESIVSGTWPDDTVYPLVMGSMRSGIPFGDEFSGQFDVDGEWNFVEDSDENYKGAVIGTVHLSWRDPLQGAAGVFGGGGGTFQAQEDNDGVLYFGGVEGQLYFDYTTLFGQAGYLDGASGNSSATEVLNQAGFGRFGARHYFDENMRLQGEINGAYGQSDSDNEDSWVAGMGVRGDIRPDGWPVGFFAKYDFTYYNADDNRNDLEAMVSHTGVVGVSFMVNAPSIFVSDRQGPAFDSPPYGRWSGQFGDTVD